MHGALGDRLVAHLGSATRRVVLVAPFIKCQPMSRLLCAVPDQIPVTVYTRWRADEVAAGVSDTSVLDLITDRAGSYLRLCPQLHAKAFVRDDVSLVGSANITDKALGWGCPTNFELLLSVPTESPELQDLLTEVESNSTPATKEIRSRIEDDARLLAEQLAYVVPAASQIEPIWIPQTAEPRHLYDAYTKGSGDAQERSDLTALSLPPNLDRGNFTRLVSLRLDTAPFFRALVAQMMLAGRVDDVDVANTLEIIHADSGLDPKSLFNVATRWFDEFRPGEFRTQPSAFELVPGRRL